MLVARIDFSPSASGRSSERVEHFILRKRQVDSGVQYIVSIPEFGRSHAPIERLTISDPTGDLNTAFTEVEMSDCDTVSDGLSVSVIATGSCQPVPFIDMHLADHDTYTPLDNVRDIALTDFLDRLAPEDPTAADSSLD